MIVDRLEDTDGFAGLYGEVVIEDCYRLKNLYFKPDIVLDLGGNIGIFARHARQVFPDALIISVEPDFENCVHFRKFTNDPNIILLNKAIGSGQMWHYLGSPNGAHACYISAGTGYPPETLNEGPDMEMVETDTTTVQELIDRYVPAGKTSLLKIDIEGNEHTIFSDPEAMEAMHRIDYIAMEVHNYAANGAHIEQVRDESRSALLGLGTTHMIEIQPNHFFGYKMI